MVLHAAVQVCAAGCPGHDAGNEDVFFVIFYRIEKKNDIIRNVLVILMGVLQVYKKNK